MDSKAPPFFDILIQEDQQRYIELRASLSSEKRRYQRFRRTDSFDEILSEIKHFCIRNDDDDWKRCLVCGVCWPTGCIGINVRQLALLIDKSKSNINGVFAKMGYISDQSNLEFKRSLIECLPILKGNHLEQRFWTIRYNPTLTPAPQHIVQYSSPEEVAMTSSPPAIAAYTPQPVRKEIEVPAGDHIKSMFDLFDMKIKTDRECGMDCEAYDFYADAACCCPIEWFTPQTPVENLFSYA